MKQYDFVSDVDESGKENVSVAHAPKRKKIDIAPMIICFFIALLIWIYMINLNDTGKILLELVYFLCKSFQVLGRVNIFLVKVVLQFVTTVVPIVPLYSGITCSLPLLFIL